MNSFDIIVTLGLLIAVVTGFNTGLVRSAVTILAYLVAAPLAMAAMSLLSPPANGKLVSALAQNGLVFFGIFLFAGMALGKLARVAVDEVTGTEAGILDRLCGAALGAVRVGLIAVTIVVVVDQFLPPRLQPSWLTGSQLRPWLSAAGQKGVKSLPPDVAATLDRLKRNQQI
ncbi:MAG: CvpA family protein [Bradyrhizobium sp.]